jgi:catechol 2,3-dioxygenase-like lactoylglutathione lyase family enzyme
MKAGMMQAGAIALLCVAGAVAASSAAPGEATPALPPPSFHHLHLNVVDPDAMIAFLNRQFPSTSRTSWGGQPALASPTNVLILFNRVSAPPPSDPSTTAFWHFGWLVQDERRNLALYQSRPEVKLAPLYTTDAGGYVYISSDTWPGTGGVLGLTRAQILDAKARGVKPLGGGGFAYILGPENTLIEYAGDAPFEHFNHVHMSEQDPFCAQLWYQRHLEAAIPPPANAPTAPAAIAHTEADCKVARTPDRSWPALTREGMYRAPVAGVRFGDVALMWYAPQIDQPLLPTRGHLMDHIGLGVTDLDAWVAKLRREGVRFLRQPYRLGATRAAMIEGPSREAIELVEVK